MARVVGVLASFPVKFISLSMCTAYEIGKNGNRLPARVKAAGVVRLLSMDSRIVRPTLMAPVIMPDGDVQEMSWGFRRKFRGAKGPVLRTIVNSREDKLDSRMWSEAFRLRRCVIPAVAFYEWVESAGGKSVPLRFTRQDDEWLLLAGIWEEGESGVCFSMLTTEPTEYVRRVHDRMPAVLADEQVEPFLDGELHTFGPSTVALAGVEAANFLKSEPPGDSQGFLF